MFKAYRFRIYPDNQQLQQLAKHFGHSRYFYNRLVENNTSESAIKSKSLSSQLKQLCLEQPDLSDIHPVIANCTLSNSALTYQPDLRNSPVSQKEKIRCVGLDMGIKYFLTMSDGTQIENPRYFDEDLKRLRLKQKTLARKAKGSSYHQKQRLLIARHYERIATRRNAFLHKLSTQIIREYDIIAVEKPAINDLLAEKQLLCKISDASWRKFITMLAYKADWYGKQLIQIDRYYPLSKTCCKCHYKIEELPLYVRDWQCSSCETPHDRDINAAINIMIQGVKIYLKNNPDAKQKQQLIPALSNKR